MATAQINRSLTNIRTELEFLLDSEVIDEPLYDALMASLPRRFAKDDRKWGLDKMKLLGAPQNGKSLPAVDDATAALSKASLVDVPPPSYPPAAAPEPAEKVLGYYRSMYAYDAREMGDLSLKKDDKLAVVEELSADWWRGYKQGQLASAAGIFPSNYVTKISESDFNDTALSRPLVDVPKPVGSPYQQPAPVQQYNQPLQQQPSYGGYAQFPPPPVNYGPMQPMQPMQPQYSAPPSQEQPQSLGLGFKESHPHMSKFGGKLGNAAIFGAGATIGGNIVNLIF
ncbi:hypothetical protein PUMCH_001653 [Australozyma saopauloensis]|uniref:SH3 domain-containing protein n=1 Tax=Australozyma saopauloensis TaxID=291208 RepID=A0AAX4H791_9ASCO|nr:hypothetical protein PUMCH_001653 [[Candida] saopauloensis]